MSIRKIQSSDFIQLLPLLAELGYPTNLDDFAKRYKRYTQNIGNDLAVCEIDTQIAGFIAWSKSYLIVSDMTRYHIDGLLVSKHFQGQQIGKALMAYVENIAMANKPAIVDLTSGLRRKNDGSHLFYKKIGYQNEGTMAKAYFRKTFT